MDTHEWLRFLERAVEQTLEGICIIDRDEKVLYMNQAWMKMHAFETIDYKSLLGQYIGIFHTPEQLEKDVKPIQEKTSKKGFYQAEIGHKRKDGTLFPTLMTSTVVLDEKGIVIGYIGTAQDISEEKRIQESIALERKIFNKIIENMPFAMVIYNPEGYIIKGNKASIELFGAQPPPSYSILKDPLLIKLGWVDQLLQAVKHGKVLKINNVQYNAHLIYPQAPDKLLIINAIAFPIFDVKGNLENLINIYEDITEQKRAEEELTKKDLEVQFSSVISMISSIFIHDSIKIDENILNSFKTLGFTIDCDFIAILKYQSTPEKQFETKWYWTPKNTEIYKDQIVSMLNNILLDYWDHPPENLFLKFQFPPKKRSKGFRHEEHFKLHSLLFVPIYHGKDRFGVMVLNRGKEKADFSTREISLSLQVSILISLALKNEALYNNKR